MPGTRKLGRKTAHRNLMLRGMVTFLLDNGKIETTLTRAKEVRSMTEKMITLGKKNTLASRRQALAYITKEDVVKKVFDQIAPSYADRNGGYTRIYKLGPRRGDGAEMALIALVQNEEKKAAEETKKTAKKTSSRKTASKKNADQAVAEEVKETKAEETTAAEESEAKEAVETEVAAEAEQADNTAPAEEKAEEEKTEE